MFDQLVASGGRRRRTWSAQTVTTSVVLHLLLLGGAVYASVNSGPADARPVEEEVTFLDLAEAEPEPEAPAAPEVEEPPPAPEAPPDVPLPPPPPGFQELLPPVEPPSVLPPVDTRQLAVRAEDFSGVGQAGGVARGVEGGRPTNQVPDSVVPVFAIEETGVNPELTNLREIQRILERNYPRQHANAGIPGRVEVRFMIDEQGRVPESSISVVNASDDAFGSAAREAASRLRFRPIRYRGNTVRVWATMPITFQAPR